MNRRRASRLAILVALFLAAFCSSPAKTEPLITQFVGTGSSLSYLVLDFQDNTAIPSYAFGYRYDGTKTGGDMVDTLVRDAGLGVQFGSFFQPNDFVISFAYAGHVQPQPGPSDPNFFWSYWLGTNGLDWTPSPVGLRDRVLSNGSWDGWSWSTFDPNTFDPVSPPRTPQVSGTAVPEPGALPLMGSVLMGVGSVAVLRRRRSRPLTG